MLENNISTVNNDVKTLVKDAQALFTAATALTGEKAEELRGRGMRALDTALAKAQEAQVKAVESGKQAAATTDAYVKDNPWRSVAVAAGIGLLVGVIVGRK
ncbi:DUF883 family protein [Pseudoduganella buxea]|uniref:DUF883 family protein n=1 Tax=Pseudoduganella buxea TaxID=1949069 RepID=A0A6I3SXC0_9BURK|nr:DUF883 family protein [Pseudoduganella buxea]MTV53823.1 DUF883 family protein [Pseudoduganella buxea]GGC01056.1 hypothetical protein GCM10011572_23820 [Pseudoduganella buxea]